MESPEFVPETAREAEPGNAPRDEELAGDAERRYAGEGEPAPEEADPAIDHQHPSSDPRRVEGGL